MDKVIFIVLLITISMTKGEYYKGEILYDVLEEATISNTSCKQQGPICDCSDISTIYYCMKSGPNTYKVSKLGTCSGDTPACLETAPSYCAATNPNCQVIDYNMDCAAANTDGFFPDPFNCSIYHICALTTFDNGTRQFVNTKSKCDYGYGYNASSTFCGIKLTNNNCNSPPIPICPSLGYVSAVPSNPAIYYICIMNPDSSSNKIVKYIPQMSVCAYGDSFSVNDKSCPRYSDIVCGDYKNIPYIFNNTAYYDCSNTANPELKNCATGSIFDIPTLDCKSSS